MGQSDHDLVARVREGDAEAFEVLFARHAARVRRHVARIVRDPSAADDLAQEVFLRLWTRAERWEGRGAFPAWLRRVATNLALNHLRSLRRRRQRPLSLPRPDPNEEDEGLVPGWMIDAAALGPDAVAERAERDERLRQLVDELPDEKREAVRLMYEEDLDVTGVARELGVPEGTVKSRLYSARKHIAREWESEGEEQA